MCKAVAWITGAFQVGLSKAANELATGWVLDLVAQVSKSNHAMKTAAEQPQEAEL